MSSKPLILKEQQHQLTRQTNLPRLSIERLFAFSIVEVKFKRKINPPYSARRMLCTSNWRFIRSPLVRSLFKFQPPKGRVHRGAEWYRRRKIILVWDIMKLQWRCVSLLKYEICSAMPVKDLLEQAKFKAFYMRYIRPLSPGKKEAYSHQP